jgi:hypothetical protein
LLAPPWGGAEGGGRSGKRTRHRDWLGCPDQSFGCTAQPWREPSKEVIGECECQVTNLRWGSPSLSLGSLPLQSHCSDSVVYTASSSLDIMLSNPFDTCALAPALTSNNCDVFLRALKAAKPGLFRSQGTTLQVESVCVNADDPSSHESVSDLVTKDEDVENLLRVRNSLPKTIIVVADTETEASRIPGRHIHVRRSYTCQGSWS